LLTPQNRAETLELIMARERLNRISAEQAYRKVVPHARINPAAINTVIELRKEMDVYKPPCDPPERFFDASYWREAMKATSLKTCS